METESKKGAIRYLFRLLFQRIIGIGLFFATAGTFHNLRGIVNLSLYLLVSIIVCIIMFLGHKETLSERGKKQHNTKYWDKIILPIYFVLAYFGIYCIAGLGVRLNWNTLSIEWFYVGILLYIVSCIFTILPVLENKHFESTSRIQDNREQNVITTGPYKIIRHPGYSGIVVWAIATTLMFGTLSVGIVSLIIILVIVIRTFLEDKMLKNELKGYLDYSNKVKYKLIPFIW